MIRIIAIIAASLALAACSKTLTDTACTALGPIDYSASQDSPDTVTGVRRHNAAWHSLCD